MYLERGGCLESVYDSVFSGNAGLQGGALAAQGGQRVGPAAGTGVCGRASW